MGWDGTGLKGMGRDGILDIATSYLLTSSLCNFIVSRLWSEVILRCQCLVNQSLFCG